MFLIGGECLKCPIGCNICGAPDAENIKCTECTSEFDLQEDDMCEIKKDFKQDCDTGYY